MDEFERVGLERFRDERNPHYIAPIDRDYVPGEYARQSPGGDARQERKSPPLDPAAGAFRRIPGEWYHSRATMELEQERLWPKTWVCAGRASDVEDVGSWFKFDLARESFIIVRSDESTIKAFYNLCHHRGNQLVHKDFGKSDAFVCSYHSWAFALSGDLLRVTDRELFEPSVLCGNLNMTEVRCETWAGFVFICEDMSAPPLRAFLDELPDVLDAYRMEEMHVVKDFVVAMDANWKTVLDAFNEAYHLHCTHWDQSAILDDLHMQTDFFKNGHNIARIAIGLPTTRLADRTTVTPLMQMYLQENGVDPATFTGDALDVYPALQAAKRKPDNHFGLDYSRYTDLQLLDDWNPTIFPNMTFNAHPEGVLVMRYLPHASDPEKSYHHVMVLAPKLRDGVNPPFYFGVEPTDDISGATRPERKHTHMNDAQAGHVIDQDIKNIKHVQKGLHSKAFKGVRFSEQEKRCQQCFYEIDLYLRGAKEFG